MRCMYVILYVYVCVYVYIYIHTNVCITYVHTYYIDWCTKIRRFLSSSLSSNTQNLKESKIVFVKKAHVMQF